jgi:glycosyltransferase involved in cell wall biosynthesis
VEIWEAARLVHVRRTRENVGRVLETHTRGVQAARARMRAWRPDAVITNSENVWFGGMAARSLGIPHLQVFHALTLEHHRGRGSRTARGYLRWLAWWSVKFIGVSQTVVEMLTRNGVAAGRAALVWNGLNFEAIQAGGGAVPPEVEARMEGRAPRVVMLGRISAMKGHDLLVEALARVRARFPETVCLLGGGLLSAEGVEDTNAFLRTLKERIRELNLQENVVFLGEIEYAPALLGRADLYVQASRTESFGRAVVEAMACGVPVAAFRAGALPEVIGEGGALAEAGNADALAEAMLCLLENREARERAVAEGKEQIRKFDVRDSVRALRAVLGETLDGGRQGGGR